MSYGVVYRVTCLVNGKCYHGQTTRLNPEDRWKDHWRPSSHCLALRNALTKHGHDAFTFEVIGQAGSKEELDALEKQFVTTSLAPLGYNIREGGANGRMPDEVKKKISESNKISQNRPEVKARNSAGVKAAMARPDVKARHKQAVREALAKPEVKEHRHQAMLQVFAKPEERKKRSEGSKKSWASCTAEKRSQRIQATAQACSTEEYRYRMKDVSKEVQARPEVRDKIQKSWTPERRKAQSERLKALKGNPEFENSRTSAISKAHNSPEGKAKLLSRRHRGESIEDWRKRIGLETHQAE